MKAAAHPIVGVSLSSGGAAGLAHVGVLEELAFAGVSVQCVAGTSAGALVGAAFAAGKLEEFHAAVCGITRRRMLRLLDPVWARAGLVEGRRFCEFFEPFLGERIEELPIPYAAVATDLHTGEEVVLREGAVLDAVRASAAVPGVLTPKIIDGRSLADGGLANPLPVNVARALGAQVVIAVTVLPMLDDWWPLPPRRGWPSLRRGLTARFRSRRPAHPGGNGCSAENQGATGADELRLMQVLYRATAMAQARIAFNRLYDDPPDCLIQIRVPEMGLFDLHRAAETIEIGRAAAREAAAEIQEALAAGAPFYRRVSRWLETKRAS